MIDRREKLLRRMFLSFGRTVSNERVRGLKSLTSGVPDWLIEDAIVYTLQTKAESFPPTAKQIIDSAVEISRTSASDNPEWYIELRKSARERARRRRDAERVATDGKADDGVSLDVAAPDLQRIPPGDEPGGIQQTDPESGVQGTHQETAVPPVSEQ